MLLRDAFVSVERKRFYSRGGQWGERGYERSLVIWSVVETIATCKGHCRYLPRSALENEAFELGPC